MKKIIQFIIITTIISIYTIGCSSKTDLTPDKNISSSNKSNLDKTILSSEFVFQARVIENETGILVEPVADSNELKSSDRIYVGLKDSILLDEEGHEIILSDIEVGDLIEITYDGTIKESYPAGISSSKLRIVSKATKANEENNTVNEDEYWEAYNTLAGVTMNISEVTTTFIKVDILNTTDNEMIFGDDFKIQQFIDGKWHDLTYIIDNWGFNSIAYILPKDEPTIWENNFEWLYGTLSNGTYRILKTVLVKNESSAYDSYTITADFNMK